MKFLKKGAKLIIKNPSYLFNQNKRNIKFHFDIFHGYGNLEKAINLLEKEDRNDFYNFVQSRGNPKLHYWCAEERFWKSSRKKQQNMINIE